MFVKVALVCFLAACPFVCEAQRHGCYDKPTTAIPGCTCVSQWSATDYVYKTVVTCQGNVGVSSDFHDNLRKLEGYKIDDFIITAYPNTRLPDEPFPADTKTEIKRVIIQNSPKLEGFGSKSAEAPGFLKNIGLKLKSLVIANNPAVKDDEWKKLATSLAAGTPETTDGLTTLVIYKQPSFDDLDAFSSLKNLEIIVLRGNGFTTLKYDLSTFGNLQLLDLSETIGLKKFEVVTNSKFPDTLKTLFISGASIESFSGATWDELAKLEFIDLSKNKLDCDCDMLPGNFVSEKNETKFLGSTCGKPTEANNKPFGSFCVTTDFFMSMDENNRPQMSKLF